MNLYVLLGVGRDAGPGEIKRAYRRLARKYHPDINPGDRRAADVFRKISHAYETLIDPERRRRYDVQGETGTAVLVSEFEFEGFDFSVATDASRATTFSDLFAEALHGPFAPGAQGAPEQGADLHATVTIGFEDSLRGVRLPVTVTRLERCAPCRGLGRIRGAEARCVHCDGLGHVRGVRGHMVFSRTCGACGGAGVVSYRLCAACGGEGVGVHTGPVTVDVPAGIPEGTSLVVPGEGHAGRRGGVPGAMRLTVTVRPHPFFRRVGDDVWIEVPVAIHEAALGARIEIPTVDGPVKVRILPGTPSGQMIRLRDRGAPTSDGRRGDLVVVVRLVLPRHLDERSRAILQEFGERNPADPREAWRATLAASETETPAPAGRGRGSTVGATRQDHGRAEPSAVPNAAARRMNDRAIDPERE